MLGGGGAWKGVASARPKTATKGSQGSKNVAGGYARTGVFGLGRKDSSSSIPVFDRSGSMGGHGSTPLAAGAAQLIKSLHDLGQTHQFQIIFYNERPSVFNLSGVAGRLFRHR